MYVRRDSTGPAIISYAKSAKFKNTVLQYWPTTTINGVKVFDRLYTYSGGAVNESASAKKIYKLIGVTVSELKSRKYKGIESTWLYLKANGANSSVSYSLADADITSYMEDFSPQIYPNSKDPFNSDPAANTDMNPDPYKNNPQWVYADTDGDGDFEAVDTSIPEPQWDKDGWITTYLTYKPPQTSDVPDTAMTNAQILSLVELGDKTNIHFDDEEGHPLTFASILDTANIMFENTARIVQREVERRTTHTVVLNDPTSVSTSVGNYLVSAVIEYKFRRIRDSSDPAVASFITKLKQELDALTIQANSAFNSRWFKKQGNIGKSVYSSISKQLIRMYEFERNPDDSVLTYAGHLRYDAMAALTVKNFSKVFLKQMDHGQKLKKVKWYKKVLVVIIVIVAIVFAVFFAAFGMFWMSAIVLAVGQLAIMGLSMHWANNGDPAAAKMAGNASEILGYVSLAFGVYAMMTSVYDKLLTQAAMDEISNQIKQELVQDGIENITSEASKEALKEITKEAILNSSEDILGQTISNLSIGDVFSYTMHNISDIAISGVKEVALSVVPNFSSQTTSEILLSGVKTLNFAFNTYKQYIDPMPDRLDDKAKQLEDSNKKLEETAGAEMLDSIEVQYSDPYDNWIDINELMQRMPYNMTQGKNAQLMSISFNSGF